MYKLITIEGVSGIGKTKIFNELKKYETDIIYNNEINDSSLSNLNNDIYKYLSSTNSRFFDTNNPKLETLLIAAKQSHDEEQFEKIANGNIILSDRGFDTICIIEGIMMALKSGGDPKKYIDDLYSSLSNFNKVPDKTILLTGDLFHAIARAEKRDNQKYTKKELKILKLSYEYFNEYANKNKDRFIIINVDQKPKKEILKDIRDVISNMKEEKMKITLVTGNWAKTAQAKAILEPHGFEVDNQKLDTVEIQADRVEDVAAYSAKWASEKLQTNVVKNDTGIMIEGLNGFPAAYTHYVGDTIGIDGILKLMEGLENRKAKFVQALAYCEYGKDPVVFTSETYGTISKEKQGEFGWSWDFIFIPEGQTKTLACFEDDIRLKMWNDTGYEQLIKYLKNKDLDTDISRTKQTKSK